MSKVEKNEHLDSSGYFILDELPNDCELAHIPSQLWLLLTLEIVVSDSTGESLVLTYPSYGLEHDSDSDGVAEGYWTPPFLGYPINLGYRTPDTVGVIKELCDKYEESLESAAQVNQLAYTMGLPSPAISKIGSIIELKRSPRTPGLWKCYKVVRYCCEQLGSRGRRNLADPENRKGYVFLPLTNMETVLKSQLSEKHARVERYYLSKPLVSNLDYVLSSKETISAMRSRAIRLSDEHFKYEEEGIIVCVDLAGYGTACKYALENMHSFNDYGESISMYFRHSIARIFYDFLSILGVTQVHTAGDGFIAAIPKRHFRIVGEDRIVDELFCSYYAMLGRVLELNNAIKDPSSWVGSRIALHYGSYRYGRIATTRSVASDFDGASVIEVARLEAALREYTKGSLHSTKCDQGDVQGTRKSSLAHSHTLICSASFCDTGVYPIFWTVRCVAIDGVAGFDFV